MVEWLRVEMDCKFDAITIIPPSHRNISTPSRHYPFVSYGRFRAWASWTPETLTLTPLKSDMGNLHWIWTRCWFGLIKVH